MLTKTWEYIAVFKKDDKTWKENPTESNQAFLNEYSEMNTWLLYSEIFLKMSLDNPS